MKNDGKKIDFNLSVLSLQELIKAYTDINEFLAFLSEKRIIEDKKENKNE